MVVAVVLMVIAAPAAFTFSMDGAVTARQLLDLCYWCIYGGIVCLYLAGLAELPPCVGYLRFAMANHNTLLIRFTIIFISWHKKSLSFLDVRFYYADTQPFCNGFVFNGSISSLD